MKKNKKAFFILLILIIIVIAIIFINRNKTNLSNIILNKTENLETNLTEYYSEYEEIGQNAYISSVAITGKKTGVGPFDDATDTDSSNSDNSVTWTAGDDSSEDNDIVRSFDQITWTVENTFSLKGETSLGESYKGGVICIEAIVPDDLAGLVEWDLDSMAWAENATVSDDGTELTAYYTMTTEDVTVPGKQDLVFVLQVYGASNGMKIVPTFNVNLYGNDEGEDASIEGDEIYVSAAPSYNIKLERSTACNARVTVDYGDGDTNGRMYGYSVVLQLYNEDSSKGLKGLEYPEGDITFDIDLKLEASETGSTDVEDITDESNLILWNYKINDTTAGGNISNRKMNFSDNATYAWTTAPYGTVQSNRQSSVYNSGEVVMEQNGSTLSTTVNGYEFDGIFPKYNAAYTSTSTIKYGDNVGCFSVIYFQIFVPDNDATTLDNTDYYLSVSDSNLSITSVGKTKVTEQIITSDDSDTVQHVRFATGSFNHYMYIHDKDKVMINSHYTQGDAKVVRDQVFSVRSIFGISTSNDYDDYIYTIDRLVKFDGDAVEPTQYNGNYYVSSSYASTMSFKMWFVTKSDGTNWSSQTEMNSTQIEEMVLYENLEDIPDGWICTGVYFESVDGYLAPPTSNNNLCLYIYLKVKETATIGQTYGLTQSSRYWRTQLDRNIYSQSVVNGYDDYPTTTWKALDRNYIKTEYDENGNIISGTHSGSYNYGQTILVVGALQNITIDAIDEDSGDEKVNYDFSKNEYDVTYEVTPSLVEYDSSTISEITGVTVKVIVTLPEGMSYVAGSGSYGEPEITENDDGTTTLVWHIYDCTVGEAITALTFTAHMDEETANGTQYDVATIMVSDNDKIGNGTISERTATTSVQVINLSSYSFYKTTETPVIEVNGEIHYKITALNNTDNDVTDFQLLDILPYNDDGRGTSYHGTYTVSQIVITQKNTSTSSEITDNDLNLYVTSDESVRSGVTAKDTDLGTTDIWSSTSSGKAIGEELTAYAVTGTLEARERLEIDIYLKTSGNEPYDLYKNSATAQTNTETEVMETSIITVQDVKRSIEGYVWYDENGDGVISDGEEYLSGVTVTLLNSDGTTAMDVSENEITSTTTDEYGYYEFEDMVRGDYIVQFQLATEVMGVNYEFTSKGTGSNIEINSKVDSSGTTDIITTLNSVESPVITESYVNAGIKMTDAEITSTITKAGVVVENEEETAIATLSLDEEANESDANSEDNSDTGSNTVDNNSNITNKSGAENSLTENSTGNVNGTTTGNTTRNENETTENTANNVNGETTENNVNIQSSATTNSESSNTTNQENEIENNETDNNGTNSNSTNSNSAENSTSENETNTSSSNLGNSNEEYENSESTTSTESSFTYSLSTTALGEEEEDTNTLTKESQSMMYTINYTTKVKDYIGKATVTIVDTLPYELEDGYTYTVTLNGETVNVTAVYDADSKTLTWEIPIDNIYTYETTDTTVIDGNISIEIILYLKYKDIDYEQDSLTNTVTGDIYLEETKQNGTQVEDKASTDIDLNLIDIKVTKNWDDNNNSLGIRPSEISITLTATANGTTYSLDGITTTTITLNSTGGWSYTWEDLPKYDSDGNTINYEITENLSTEQQRIYTINVEEDTTQTSKLLASYIITNTYTGCTEYEDIIVNKVWKGDTTKTEDGDGNEVEEISSSRPTETTVELSATANGTDYSLDEITTTTITLNSTDGWNYSWENLPKYTETGQEIEYSIQETSTFEDYYLSSITSDTTVDGEITYTVTNSKYGSITLTKVEKKVDKTDTSTKLGGATFKLEKLLEENEEYVVDESFEAIILTTESDTESKDFGTLTFESLEYGIYKITETVAPEGYSLSTDTLTVTVDSDNVETSVTATDKKKTTLPETGQNGVFYVIIAGITLLIIGIKTGRVKIVRVDSTGGNTYKSKY